MKVIAGDETGLIKSITVETNVHEYVTDPSAQSRTHGIEHMCWNGPNRVIASMKNHHVCQYQVDSKQCDWDIELKEQHPLVGLACIENTTLLSCSTKGSVQVQNLQAREPVLTRSFNIKSGQDLCRMRLSSSHDVFATGGKESDLQLVDLETGQAVFRAKNVPHDDLELQVPVWIRDLAFISQDSHHLVLTGSAHRHVRVYDTKAQRRPVQSITFGDHPITSVLATPGRHTFVVADSTGDINALDRRMLKHRLGRYVGPGGAIKSLSSHAGGRPYFAATGLDRKVYVYHETSRKCLQSLYVKQRQNVVLFHHEAEIDTTLKEKKTHEDTDEVAEPESESSEDEEDYEGLEL